MEDGTNSFHHNEYSWNTAANMVYLESPAGVGYSYCGNMSECNFTDDLSSADNLQAVLNFFLMKFPEYQQHDLYIAGESYAGVYVPYLALRIDEYNSNSTNTFKLNFQGFIVGNGVTDWEWDGDTTYV